MRYRRDEKRVREARKKVYLLLGSVLVLAGLLTGDHAALVMTGHAAPRQAGATRTTMMTGSMSNVLPAVDGNTVSVVFGNTINVTTTAQGIADDGQCSLQEAIYAANLDFGVAPSSFDPVVKFDTGCAPGSGDDTIVLAAGQEYLMTAPVDDPYNPVGPTANPIILSNITIEANGARLVRSNPNGDFTGTNFRAFAVAKRAFADPANELGVQGTGVGNLTIRNAHIKGFTAKGGNGRDGGGGRLGAGGAIYVHDAWLVIDNSTFERNGAGGGNGSERGRGYPGGAGPRSPVAAGAVPRTA